MSTTLYVKTTQDSRTVLQLIQTTINSEITKLGLALEMADKRLQPFEQKYGVTSDYFIEHLAAEDLDGGDDEYVCWAGEYKLKQSLVDKLQRLQDIEYDHSDVFQTY